MFAIPDEGVYVSVCDPRILALGVGTSKPLGVYAFRGSSSAFHLTPGPHSRRGSGGETTGGAIVWAAGLEQTLDGSVPCHRFRVGMAMDPGKVPKPWQGEQQQEHEQERVLGHRDPLCLR